jgi:fibronectin-binding autotransporter adhesin
MTRRAARLAVILSLMLMLMGNSWMAWAQYQSAPGYVVGTVGGTCSSSSVTYGWPDTNGDVLKCVSNVWTLVTQPATAGGSNGQVQFNSSNLLAGSANLFWDNTNYRLGIYTSSPDAVLSLGGQSAQTIDVLRETTSNTGGSNLTVKAGGAYNGGTDLAGGNLIVSSGISTGTRTSNVQVQVYPAASSTSSSDNTATTALTISETGSASSGQGTLAATVQGTAGSGTDENGSTLTLASGVSTGTGSSSINFNVYNAAGSTGSSANSPTTAMTILGNGNVGIGQTSPTSNLQLGNHTNAGTATPVTIDMGATYSNSGGNNPKLMLYNDGTYEFGLGVSGGSLDFITYGPGGYFTFFNGPGSQLMTVGGQNLNYQGLGAQLGSSNYYWTANFGDGPSVLLGTDQEGGTASDGWIGSTYGTLSNLLFLTYNGSTYAEEMRVTGAGTIDIESNPEATEIANASTTGTTQYTLAKLTGAPSTAVIASTSDTGGIIGIVAEGAGTSGNAKIAIAGQASCVFDGATTAGHYVQISGTTAGDCTDAGSTYPGSGQVLGRVLSTNSSGGTYAVFLFGTEIKGPSGGGGQTSSASPTAPSSTSAYKMQGLSGSITPTRSGNALIIVSGTVGIGTTAAGAGLQWQISYGTGSAPTNGATETGTQVGSIQKYLNPATVTAADVAVPFSVQSRVTGLTVGTAYWIDLAAEAISVAISGKLTNVVVTAIEQ